MKQPKYLGDWLLWEADPNYCREEITVDANQNLVTGTLLGKLTAGGYVAYDPEGENGENTAVGVLITKEVKTGEGETAKAVMLARGPAVLKRAGLSGLDDDAVADLAALAAPIVVRTSA